MYVQRECVSPWDTEQGIGTLPCPTFFHIVWGTQVPGVAQQLLHQPNHPPAYACFLTWKGKGVVIASTYDVVVTFSLWIYIRLVVLYAVQS